MTGFKGKDKEEIDILNDDTVPKKKKKSQARSSAAESMEFNDRRDKSKGRKDKPTAKGKSKRSAAASSPRSSVNQSSISNMSRKRQPTIQDHMTSQFGAQFYDLVIQLSQEQQAEYNVDFNLKNSNAEKKLLNKRSERFVTNSEMLLDADGFDMPQPASLDSFPSHIREVLQFMLSVVTAGDLVALQEGETCEESLINVYFKVLEKINMVLLRSNDFLKQQQNAQASNLTVATQKVLFCNSNFIRDLKNCAPADYEALMDGPETDQKRRYQKIIKDITDNEVVLIPFYPEPT